MELALADDVPDSKTIWHFRDRLTQTNFVEQLFDLFKSELNRLGMIVLECKIVDACFVEVPNKLRQKDIDARWTKRTIKTSTDTRITLNAIRKISL